MDRQFPPAGGTGSIARSATGCGVPHQRLSALRSLTFVRETSPREPRGWKCRRTPRLARTGAAELWRFKLAGCLKREPENSRTKDAESVWRNEPKAFAHDRATPR